MAQYLDSSGLKIIADELKTAFSQVENNASSKMWDIVANLAANEKVKANTSTGRIYLVGQDDASDGTIESTYKNASVYMQSGKMYAESGSINSSETALVTGAAVNTAINTALSSALQYCGTLANDSNVSAAATKAGKKKGDVYVASAIFKPSKTYINNWKDSSVENGDLFIFDGSKFDIVNGENQVDPSGNVLAWDTSVVIATVDGTPIYAKLPSNPNSVTGITTGVSGTVTNSSTTNPYIKIKDDNTHRSQIQLKGGGITSVSSDANGAITISTTGDNWVPQTNTINNLNSITNGKGIWGWINANTTNKPDGSTSGGEGITSGGEVLSFTLNNGHCLQFASHYKGNGIYTRNRNADKVNTTEEWSKWKKLAFVEDIPTKLSQFTDDVVAGKYLKSTIYGDFDADTLFNDGFHSGHMLSHLPSGSPYGIVHTLSYRGGSNNTKPDYASQIFIPCGDDNTSPNDMFFRTSLKDSWNTWTKVITDKNIGSQSVNYATCAGTTNICIGTYTNNGGEQYPSYVTGGTTRWNMMRNSTTYYDKQLYEGYCDWMLMDNYTGFDVPYVTGIGVLKSDATRAFIMSGAKGTNNKWKIKELATKDAVVTTDTNQSIGGNKTFTGDVTANSITSPKIVVKGSNHSATMEMNTSCLKIDKELMLTAGGSADICPGIACALKADKLQVKNLISENIILGSSNTGTQSNMSFNVQKYGSISNHAPASLTTLLTVNTTGNVGIGTTSPTEKLDVAGNVKVSGDITANKFIGSIRGNIIYDNGTDEGHFIGLGSNGVGVKGLLNYVYGNFPILFYTNGFERMRIGEYVGIGTTSPTEKLDVAGNVKANSFIGNASSATVFGSSDFKVYAENSNEINFGGTKAKTNVYFGYRDKDGIAVPQNYYFGSTGGANVRAGAFCKKDSSDSYVLLGGGGHKSLSDFVKTFYKQFTPAESALTNDDVLSATGGFSLVKGTWDYAGNGYLPAGEFGNIDLSGCSVLTFGRNFGGYTQLFITAPTTATPSSKANEILFYNNHGSEYSPGWTRVLTNRNYTEYIPTNTSQLTNNNQTFIGRTDGIINNTDADNFTDSGAYLFQTGNGENNTNFPITGYGILNVFNSPYNNRTTNYIGQLLLGSYNIFYRTKIDTWSDWKQIALTSDIPTTDKQTNWDTAYGWGNHALAGYKKTDTNYYHTRSYSSGLQISTGTGVLNMYVPYATASQAGVISTGSQTFAGDKTFSKVTASAFYEGSDERLKTFGEDIKVDFDELVKLRKSHFVFNNNPTKQEIGISAQEVQKLYPEIVNTNEDGYLSVDYAKLSVIALKAVDILYNQNKDFERRLKEIEDKLK